MSATFDVTLFVTQYADCMERFSDSVANSGMDNIAAITWRNAVAAGRDAALTAGWDACALVSHFRAYGAWEQHELVEMPDYERFALLIQFIAGDYQRFVAADYDADRDGGRLFQGSAGRWCYSIGG
jgi:hypothetical protein